MLQCCAIYALRNLNQKVCLGQKLKQFIKEMLAHIYDFSWQTRTASLLKFGVICVCWNCAIFCAPEKYGKIMFVGTAEIASRIHKSSHKK